MKSKVLEFAEKRLKDEIYQEQLGAKNQQDIQYWIAYIDGVKARMKEENRQ